MSSPDDEVFKHRYDRFEHAWAEVEQAARARRARWWRRAPVRWVKRASVCWWRHRTRRPAPGVYLVTGCWACTGRNAR